MVWQKEWWPQNPCRLFTVHIVFVITESYWLFKKLWLKSKAFLTGQKFPSLNVILNMSDKGNFFIKGTGV